MCHSWAIDLLKDVSEMVENKNSALEHLEIKKREAEITLAQMQIEEKKREASRNNNLGLLNISIPVATVIVGILSFLGSTVGTYLVKEREFKAQNDQKHQEFIDQIGLKKKELESQLLLAALKEDDKKRVWNKLAFS